MCRQTAPSMKRRAHLVANFEVKFAFVFYTCPWCIF